jgi:hypothetical protein
MYSYLCLSKDEFWMANMVREASNGLKFPGIIERPLELKRDAEWAVELYRSKGQSQSRLLVGDTKV